MNRILRLALAAAAAIALGWCQAAIAQGFPVKPIRIVLPFPPGGPTDTLARLLGSKVSVSVGQPVLVENRPGGAGQIAAAALMQSDPDGYTVMIADMGVLSINSSLYRTLSYRAERDFAPVTNLTVMPMILLVPAASRAGSVAELVALSKTEANGLNYASQGPGSGGHLMAELFRTATGARLTHVPYKGSAPAIADLIADRCDLLFDVTLVARPNIASGKLKALAAASASRTPFFPELKTLNELGYPKLVMDAWFGLVARAGTSPAVIQRLNTEFVKALEDPELNRRFAEIAMVPRPMPPEQFAAFMRSEAATWGAAVKEFDIHVD